MNKEFPVSYRAPYQPGPDPELMEEVRGMSSTQLEGLRRRAQVDRYFLARGVLGYRDVNPYTHGPMCRFIEDRSKNRRMGLAPRGHLKSTLWTVTDSIGLSLEDPDETRILIINEIEDNSVGFLAEIKAHWESGELLRALFPEIVPERTGGPGSRWSGSKACVNRKTNYKEWTYNAIGLGGAVTSRHFTHIKCDDLIGLEARQSPAEMNRAITYAKSLEPLLVDMDADFIDFIGTRWSLVDLYRKMLDAYGDDMMYFAREDIEQVPDLPFSMLRDAGFGWNGKGKPELSDAEILAKIGTMQPIFPKKFSLHRLQTLSVIEPELYYAQYKNSPIAAGIRDFDATKLNWFDLDDEDGVVYRDQQTGSLRRWNREQLDVVMTCDPNSGELTAPDLPAIVVSAQSPRDQVFVLESWARRVQPDAYVDKIFDLWKRWKPRILGIEKAGQQTTAFYFKKKAKELDVYINVEPLLHRNRQKEERIRKALQPIVNLRRMYVRKEQTTLRRQFEFFPNLENDDEVDALAYGTELWRTPLTQAELDEEEEVANVVMRRRSRLTGYGA